MVVKYVIYTEGITNIYIYREVADKMLFHGFMMVSKKPTSIVMVGAIRLLIKGPSHSG